MWRGRQICPYCIMQMYGDTPKIHSFQWGLSGSALYRKTRRCFFYFLQISRFSRNFQKIKKHLRVLKKTFFSIIWHMVGEFCIKNVVFTVDGGGMSWGVAAEEVLYKGADWLSPRHTHQSRRQYHPFPPGGPQVHAFWSCAARRWTSTLSEPQLNRTAFYIPIEEGSRSNPIQFLKKINVVFLNLKYWRINW